MRNNILILLLLAIHIISFGQQTGTRISGVVYDKQTGEPLENTNIQIQNSNYGAITNDLGEFTIYSKKIPTIIVVSHIGYSTKKIAINFSPLDDLTITLNQKSTELPGVIITSDRIDTIFIDDNYAVLDYEILDDGILLLIFKNNLMRSELLFVDFSGNRLIELKILPIKPLKLYKDCLGSVHVISKHLAFQVYFRNNKILLYDGVEIGKFNAILADCQFEIKHKLYFTQSGFLDLGKSFYYINTNDKSKHILCRIMDEEKIEFFNQNPENFALFGTGGFDMDDLFGINDSEIISDIRIAHEEAHFRKIAYLSPTYLPAFKFGDSLIIFNHPKSQIEFYNFQDSLVRTTSISYHQDNIDYKGLIPSGTFKREGKWLNEVYVDPIHKKAYTLFMKSNGNKMINEIDLETGELSPAIIVPFPYVKKIGVYDASVYFIYRGWGNDQRNKLFRQKLN